ncbi:MAG: RhuM protein [Lachnospiraceae bacterium]|nr:RhuM protein [Lachnospiraceae bacterium]
MKKDTIIIEGRRVVVTGYEVWMSAGEIAALFDTTVAAVNNAVKRIWKRNVLRQGEHMQCVELGAGRSVDKYSLAVVIDLSFRLDTRRTQQLREWLLRRAVEQPKMQHIFFNPGNVYLN